MTLAKLERIDESLLASDEGIAKFANGAGKIWEDKAITYFNMGKKAQAAYSPASASATPACTAGRWASVR